LEEGGGQHGNKSARIKLPERDEEDPQPQHLYKNTQNTTNPTPDQEDETHIPYQALEGMTLHVILLVNNVLIHPTPPRPPSPPR